MSLLIRGARVLDPLAPEPRPATRDILIEGNRIARLGALDEQADDVIDARGMLALPGFVSAHYHSHDNLLKGCFEGMPLETWFLHAIPPNYPPRSREEVRARVLIGALEALKSGITTVQDMATVHPFDSGEVDTILEAYDDIGIRCVFALQVGDAPGSRGVPFWDELIPPALRGEASSSVKGGEGARELIACLDEELGRHAGRHPRVTWGLGPATPENCSEEFLALLAELSARENLPVFTHLYESKASAVIARRDYASDRRSLVRHLARVGLLGPRLTLAHGVWLRRAEMEEIAAAGARVALNPLCNLKSKSGIAPIRAYLEAGIGVGLGTDNSSCSDVQNMFQAMKLLALLSAAGAPDGASPGAVDALRAATVGSAAAIGLGGEIGSLRPGARADLVLVDLQQPAFAPLNDVVRQLVYGETGAGVRHVLVDGRVVLRERRATLIDEASLYADIEKLMPALMRDLQAVRSRNEQLLPYVEEAQRRILALDVGLERFAPGDPR